MSPTTRTASTHTGSMTIALPEPGKLGVEVTGADLLSLDAAARAELWDLVYRHKLVVFRGQDLSNEQYLEFCKRMGRPQVYFQSNYHHPDHPEIFVSSNVPMNGQKVGVAGTGQFWHTDYSFFDEPLSTTFVYPKVIPAGDRWTYYIDMVAALRDLPADLVPLVEGRSLFHDATNFYKIQPKDIDRPILELVREFREVAPGAWHPAIITHPVTGERILYCSEGFTTQIGGMTHEEYTEVLPRLFAFIRREEHVHEVPWREGTLLWWDNRTLIHQASAVEPGQKSTSYRIGVYDDRPFYVEQERRKATGELT